ncbi:hypothetical protein [Acinetobacter baumannii]|uniref:hypothetical protein n=1 Tax=Acinetobacter baumannii TaxID=470 RepID=UPI000B8C739B|nr:hypothetical protein [Acinetobacter baumannii]MBA2960333.1 hypothetical protein [Acinetobacter baumannii]MBA2969269.1 hypothetical protein [Acinetobacter baumannii]MBA2976658.1 hypothetical protein [Acinetobacter baumannii]MCJ8943105.1 hypothetical protein [Acinetobacter baumannii]MCJ9008344.1 hypothetical protein [Acinetobacter baumannii]
MKHLMNLDTNEVYTEEVWRNELATWTHPDGLTPQERFDALVPVIRVGDKWVDADEEEEEE